jgi:hypothetical protein
MPAIAEFAVYDEEDGVEDVVGDSEQSVCRSLKSARERVRFGFESLASTL